MSDLAKAIARLERSTWDSRTHPQKGDVNALIRAYRRATRPAEPKGGKPTWYRGWETGYDHTAAQWIGDGYYACHGGVDLDCITVRARTWDDLIDEIDDHEMTEEQP
jgi:hypothetical protein